VHHPAERARWLRRPGTALRLLQQTFKQRRTGTFSSVLTLARKGGDHPAFPRVRKPLSEPASAKERATRCRPAARPDPPFLRRAARTPRGPEGRAQVTERRVARRRRADVSPTSFSLRAPPVADGVSNAGLECPFEDPHRPKGADATPPREGRRLLDVRGAFHHQEPTRTGIAPTAFVGRYSAHFIHPGWGDRRFFIGGPKTFPNAVGMLRRNEYRAFGTARSRPTSTALGDAPCREAPRGAPTRPGSVDFLGGVEPASCGSVVPDQDGEACPRLGHESDWARAPSDRERPQRP